MSCLVGLVSPWSSQAPAIGRRSSTGTCWLWRTAEVLLGSVLHSPLAQSEGVGRSV